MTREERIQKVERALASFHHQAEQQARKTRRQVPVTARILAEIAVDAIGKPSALFLGDEEFDGRGIL